MMKAEDVFYLHSFVRSMKFAREHPTPTAHIVPRVTLAETEWQIAFYHNSNQAGSGLCYGVGTLRRT